MAGLKVRGRYPLTSIWLLAEARGDTAMRIRVLAFTIEIAHGIEFDASAFERLLDRYACGD